MSVEENILSIINFSINFVTQGGNVIANQDINLNLKAGEILGIVGESGSGKTVLCKSILKLLSTPPANYQSGKILFENNDLLSQSDESLQVIRQKKISMIFQNPMSAFNPVRTVGEQIIENLSNKKILSKKETKNFCIELLKKVGISTPEIRYSEYPYQWSGGMLQRAAIAMAIRNSPKILLADEPTTALDVTIQDQILALLLSIQKTTNMSMVLVSHDLGVVAETCDRIAVMYAGRIVELAKTKDLFNNPQHPYTVGLINSIPRINSHQERLQNIPGTLKTFSVYNDKCPFIERCQYVDNACKINKVKLNEIRKSHFSLCLYPERIK
tara:strand:- start:1052 stop:2035 length:984 start_codon:yes stop_codon:yes gene_type:complete